jgi:hypothetical protein
MKYLKFSRLIFFGMIGTLSSIGCSQTSGPSIPVTEADMALFEAKAATMTLAEVCADVKDTCATKNEGCTCYEYFCEKKPTEQTVCERLQNACVADCAGDKVCEKACNVKDTKCDGKDGKKKDGKGKHNKGDKNGDKDDDGDDDGDKDDDGGNDNDGDNDNDGGHDSNDGSTGGSHDGGDCPPGGTTSPTPVSAV